MTPTRREPIISCRHVWKLFGDDAQRVFREHAGQPDPEAIADAGLIPAVRDVSIEVARGEILVVMGLSGSGKSTLVRCLSRLIEVTGGEILFEGVDLVTARSRDLIALRRHKMGMVFQHFGLLPHRSVLQNVAFPLEVQGIDRAAREAKAHEIIELVGLQGREDYYPRELSGGQQQRVGIARSLAVDPEVWLLDEPFSALDPLIRREMQDEFLRLQNLLHKTIVFITHDFDEAIRLADRIAIMKDGEIVQLGTAEELVTNPATDYVREFTKDVPRDRLLTMRSAMEPGATANGDAITLRADEHLVSAVRLFLSGHERARVVDSDGAALGVVTRERVLETVFGRE